MEYYYSGTESLWCGNWNHLVCRRSKCEVDHSSQSTVVKHCLKYYIFLLKAMPCTLTRQTSAKLTVWSSPPMIVIKIHREITVLRNIKARGGTRVVTMLTWMVNTWEVNLPYLKLVRGHLNQRFTMPPFSSILFFSLFTCKPITCTSNEWHAWFHLYKTSRAERNAMELKQYWMKHSCQYWDSNLFLWDSSSVLTPIELIGLCWNTDFVREFYKYMYFLYFDISLSHD